MADDYQLGICSGVWWNPTRRGGDFNSSAAMSTTSAFSCDEPAGSASGSSITYQDAPHHHMITNQLVDSTMQHPMFTLSPSTMDWNQSLHRSSGRAETSTNFHAMLQDDMISMNQSFLLDQHNMSSSLYEPAPTELPQSSSLSNKFPNQYLKPSSPTTQQSTHHQLQFANNTHFWNASAAASGEAIRSGFYPPMPAQFTAQPIEQKPRCSNLTSKGVKEYLTGSSTTKNSSRSNEPTLKKTRIETPSPLPTFKVRKEKLGDRITALQQLVSPFGKTDTASVLHEAIEYIKFLHDQVSVLSTPYLKNGHTMQHQKEAEGPNHDLRSRGLCLVPIESTYPMASENPADFWTPTFGGTYR